MRSSRNLALALMLTGVFAGLVALSFAAVPLGRIFWQPAGHAGTTQRAEAPATVIGARMVAVRFDSEANPALPWRFLAAQKRGEVSPGGTTLVYFRAETLSARTVSGTATFKVLPVEVGRHFDKVQCFSFTEQASNLGAGIDMPVQFFVDPAMPKDADITSIEGITLGYAFFRVADAKAAEAALGVPSQPAANAAVTLN